MIKALIIDDEYLARERIKKLLVPYTEIKVLNEAKNGTQAVQQINELTPDLVFLDIQMPDFDGFEVIRQIGTKNRPYIVFTTAYDSYAIKAFGIHALDYLLKPFDEDRFEESINKVMEYFKLQKTSTFNDKLLGLLKDFQKEDSDYTSSVLIKDRGREIHVDMDEVHFIEANGNYLGFNTSKGTHLYRSTLNTFAETLNPKEFIRVHRSFVLNKRYVLRCQYLNNNEYEFNMKDGTKIISSRTYKNDITSYVSQ